MAKPKLMDIKDLLNELLVPFTQIERDMPLRTKGYPNDNDAEHSWALAVLACSLAERIDNQLDIGKVCMLAVAHDIVEIYAGDTSFWAEQEHHDSKGRREEDALARIEKRFAAFPWIAATIKEYETKDTPEAKFVYALDKFLNALTLLEGKDYYFKKAKITKQMLDERIPEHRRKASIHPGVGKYYDELLEVVENHPEYFYELGK